MNKQKTTTKQMRERIAFWLVAVTADLPDLFLVGGNRFLTGCCNAFLLIHSHR